MKTLNQYDCMQWHTMINTDGITYDDFKGMFQAISKWGTKRNEQFILTGTCDECGKKFREPHDIYATYQKLKHGTFCMCSRCKKLKDRLKHAMYATVYRGSGC